MLTSPSAISCSQLLIKLFVPVSYNPGAKYFSSSIFPAFNVMLTPSISTIHVFPSSLSVIVSSVTLSEPNSLVNSLWNEFLVTSPNPPDIAEIYANCILSFIWALSVLVLASPAFVKSPLSPT